MALKRNRKNGERRGEEKARIGRGYGITVKEFTNAMKILGKAYIDVPELDTKLKRKPSFLLRFLFYFHLIEIKKNEKK